MKKYGSSVKLRSDAWFAVVVGLLAVGESTPGKLAFTVDPATSRPMVISTVGPLDDQSECRNWLLPEVRKEVMKKKFEVSSEDCVYKSTK